MRLYAYEDPDEGLGLGLRVGDRVIPLPAWSLTSELLEEDDLAKLRRIAPAFSGAEGLPIRDVRPAIAVGPG